MTSLAATSSPDTATPHTSWAVGNTPNGSATAGGTKRASSRGTRGWLMSRTRTPSENHATKAVLPLTSAWCAVQIPAGGAATSEPAVLTAARALTPDHTFDGAFAAVISLSSLQPRLSDPSLPKGAEAGLGAPFLRNIAQNIARSNYHQNFYDQALGPSVGRVVNDVTAEIAGGSMTPKDAAKAIQAAFKQGN